jgi:hypothetical protein
MMKKISLILSLLFFVAFAFSQNFGGTYPNCVEPAGYTFSQGARITPYTNPYVGSGCNGGDNDCGIITPGVGGNNPANIIFPAVTMASGVTSLTRCFSIFVFDANLKCTSNKPFPCATYVTGYIVLASYNATTAPSPSEYYGISNKQLVDAYGAPNCVTVSFDVAPDPNQQYRLFLDFTNDGNCNQMNTKYVIDILPGSGTTPIHLSSFEGVKQASSVQLKWQTSSEQNTKYFDVEFSADGMAWDKIGEVAAAGISTIERNYALRHNSPVNGVNYYRLKQFDLNNKFNYSNIVVISFTIKGLNINSLYPNPFVNQLKIDVSSDRSETVRIQLSDNMGRVLKVQNSSIQKGVNKLVLENLAGLAPGIYNVEVKTAYTSYRFKLKK